MQADEMPPEHRLEGTSEEVIAGAPPPPPEPIPLHMPESRPPVLGDTPTEEEIRDGRRLWLFLQHESYRQRGEGFRRDWAFHLFAASNNLGAPLSMSARGDDQVRLGDERYGFQPFARDTIFNPIPRWTEISSLNATLGGVIPERGPARLLLEASFRVSGAPLRPTQAFAQLVVRERLGPPLTDGFTISVNGQRWDMQVFALDTLASLVGRPADVHRLSQLPAGNLREALWRETYNAAAGVPYQPDSAFHQFGARDQLGTPLTGVYHVDMSGIPLRVQVFAADTLCALQDGQVRRQSALPRPPELAEPRAAVTADLTIPPDMSEPTDALSTRQPVFALLPVAGQPRVSQLFGYTRFAAGAGRGFYLQTQGRHSGLDFAVPVGAPLLSIDYGLVVWAGQNIGGVSFGAGPRSIIVRYGSVYALYGHTSSELVRQGQQVYPGQQIGRSGFPSAPHLHFELRPVPSGAQANRDPGQRPVNPGFAVDPVPFFSSELRSYFEQQFANLGGSAHFCQGTMGEQERVTFGAPLDTRPCQ
jgi:murein DD-endopeptidase MepM/ murein hydrolase activator NlpD